MDVAKYVVMAVVVEGRSVRDVAESTGRTKSWVHRHAQLYRAGGDEGLIHHKRGPKVALNQTSSDLEDLIVGWRKHLNDAGYDAGAATIHYHLSQTLDTVPHVRTIHRVLVRRGFVTPQPHKRPRETWTRFESALPNECWQSDMTHWQVGDDNVTEGVEIINFVDDYSRAALSSTVVPVATSDLVVACFYRTANDFGLPSEVLSDNGAIYTANYRGAHTGLEIDLAALGITFKHGKPYHPQTQGKVERYHQTLKKFLRRQPLAANIEELQSQVNSFVLYYNETRPHTARGCPPMHAWRALDKATPALDGQPLLLNTKVRHDVVDQSGSVTLRYRGRLHHVGMGRAHKGQRVLMLVADRDIRVIDTEGKLLQHLTLNPAVDYQPISRCTL